MIFPSKQLIIDLNRDLIKNYGGYFEGEDNLENPSSLDWVLEAIQYPIFGYDKYPSISKKAAVLGWIINTGHVFYDGNKRTSTMAILIFLSANGFALNSSKEELIQIAERISKYKETNFSLDEYTLWIEERIVLKGYKT